MAYAVQTLQNLFLRIVAMSNEDSEVDQNRYVTTLSDNDVREVNQILDNVKNDYNHEYNIYPVLIVAGNPPTEEYKRHIPYGWDGICETIDTDTTPNFVEYRPQAWKENEDGSLTLYDTTLPAAESVFELEIPAEAILGYRSIEPDDLPEDSSLTVTRTQTIEENYELNRGRKIDDPISSEVVETKPLKNEVCKLNGEYVASSNIRRLQLEETLAES